MHTDMMKDVPDGPLEQTHHLTTTSLAWRGCCALDATLTTTGPCGGDAGHGGYTEVTLVDGGGTVIGRRRRCSTSACRVRRSAVLRFCGDDEMAGIAAVLQELAKRLAR